LADGFRWIEGLVWMGDAGCLLFQDLPRDRTMRWIEDAGVSIYRAPSGYANGQTRDRQGRLISCSHRERCVLRTELDGSVTRLADSYEGRRLNSPNDVTVRSDGSIWFTDPLYGIQSDYEGGRQRSERPAAVYRLDPDAGELRIVADDFDGPNGLVFSPDEKRLYISETGDQSAAQPRQWIRVFDVGARGRLSGGEVFHKIEPGYADGMCVDEDGNLWSSAAAESLAVFYETALGCRRLQVQRREGRRFEQLMNVRGGARAVTLALGAQTLELLQFDEPGQAYAGGGSASDLSFQHFAILVKDMQAAFRQLAATPGWTAISRDGPQRLPQSSGGVTAFKFRDPEGHPLELLAMPVPVAPDPATSELWCGIDHSAISVSDTMRSVAFYEELGLRLKATSYNHGMEQARLDDVDAPSLEVTA